jgi:hypothetical protein
VPFTPFHLGPGALIKAIGGERFSFMIFGGSQVLMDVEPLVRMIRGDPVLHGMSHTIAGALVIGVVSAVVGRPLSNALLRQSDISDQAISWRVAWASALIGTYSHVGLDAMVHSDMNPLWTIACGNTLLGALPVGTLHILCVVSGLIGGAFVALRIRREA